MSEMELGNLIFGNSRGEFPIDRSPSWEGPWEELTETLKINWRGYPDDGCLASNNGWLIETPVFLIRPYDCDAECDCGFDEDAESWHDKNPHSAECYQSAIESIMDQYDARTKYKDVERAAFEGNSNPLTRGMDMVGEDIVIDGNVVGRTMTMTPRRDNYMEAWRVATDLRRDFEDKERKRLCAERGLSYPDGCAVHCVCYKEKAAEKFFAERDHAPECRLVQPNFLYKPSGFCINWYKYPFRDSYSSQKLRSSEWRKIVRHCIDSCLSKDS